MPSNYDEAVMLKWGRVMLCHGRDAAPTCADLVRKRTPHAPEPCGGAAARRWCAASSGARQITPGVVAGPGWGSMTVAPRLAWRDSA